MLIVIDKVFLSFLEVCGSLFGLICVYRRDFDEFWNVIVFGKKLFVKFVLLLKVSIIDFYVIFVSFNLSLIVM